MSQPDALVQDRYRIVRLLGTGGFARVYLAYDERLGRQVALKELSSARLDDHERQTALDLFEGEARMLASLAHPGLTKIWDYFQHDGRAYLVMEYVPGRTLRDLLSESGGPLPEPLVLACGLQLCDVLQYLHDRRPPVIFRDLKPANVIVEELPDGTPPDPASLAPDTLRLKLIDFGIARLFKPEQSADTMVIGTPGYASPEQYGHGQTDARSDVYSLGATLHHLRSGAAPAGLILPRIEEVAPDVSPALARIITRATMLSPAERYPDVAAIRRELLAIVQANGAALPKPPRPAPPPNPHATVQLPPQTAPAAKRSRLLPLLGLALVVLLGLGLLGWWRGRDSDPQPPAAGTAPAEQTGEWVIPGAGGRILFGQASGEGLLYDIWLATPDGQPPRQLLGGGNNTAVAWSADGQRVAITRDGAIFVGTPDNLTERQISPAGELARYPAFSPDGRSLAFTISPGRNGVYQLAVADLASGALELLEPSALGWVSWGPDGIVYAGQAAPGQPQDLFVMGPDRNPRNLTNTPEAEEDFPAVSPDGRQIAFTASPAGTSNLDQRQITVMDAGGGNRASVTTAAGPHTNAVWSPDGRWLAYLSRATGEWQVWAARASGEDQRQVTSGQPPKFYLAWAQ